MFKGLRLRVFSKFKGVVIAIRLGLFSGFINEVVN